MLKAPYYTSAAAIRDYITARGIIFNNFKINFYKDLYNYFIVGINYILYYIAYYGYYIFNQSSYNYISWLSQLGQLK